MNSVLFLKSIIDMLAGNATLRLFSNEESFQSKLKNLLFYFSEGAFQIPLDEKNRKIIRDWDDNNDILDFVERLEIIKDGKLLFEGYDGMEFGTLSKTVDVNQRFRTKYLDGDRCIISKDW